MTFPPKTAFVFSRASKMHSESEEYEEIWEYSAASSLNVAIKKSANGCTFSNFLQQNRVHITWVSNKDIDKQSL